MHSLIGKQLGDYAVETKLGDGGFGAVFAGRHVRTGRRYAIKVLRPDRALVSPDARERFRREAEALSSLGHVGIVRIHDYASEDGVDFLVMDLLEGDDLATRLRAGPLSTAAARRIVQQIGDALIAAHARGFVHRDLKPGNIFLARTAGEEERAVLLDFGLAKSVAPGAAPSLTGSAEALGTPQYMAPEQATGDRIDARADVYGLAAILFEMLTGRAPFTGQNAASILLEVMTVTPPRVDTLVEVPTHWADAIARGLEKDRGQRFDDVGQFLSALSGDVSDSVPRTRVLDASDARAMSSGNQHAALAQSSVRPPPPTSASPVILEPSADDGPRGGKAKYFVAAGIVAALAIAVAVPFSGVLEAERGFTEPPPVAPRESEPPVPFPGPTESEAESETPDTEAEAEAESAEAESEAETSEVGTPPVDVAEPSDPRRVRRVRRARAVVEEESPAAPDEAPVPAPTTTMPSTQVQGANAQMVQQFEGQIAAMRDFLRVVPTVREVVAPLRQGDEPGLCSRRPRLPASDVPQVVSAVQQVRRILDASCEPFERARHPSEAARERMRTLSREIDRGVERTRATYSSNQPLDVAEQIREALLRAREEIAPALAGRRTFECDARIWSELRTLQNAGNSYSGSAARTVLQKVDRVCSEFGVGRSRLRPMADRHSDQLDGVESMLNSSIRTLERSLIPLRAMAGTP